MNDESDGDRSRTRESVETRQLASCLFDRLDRTFDEVFERPVHGRAGYAHCGIWLSIRIQNGSSDDSQSQDRFLIGQCVAMLSNLLQSFFQHRETRWCMRRDSDAFA